MTTAAMAGCTALRAEGFAETHHSVCGLNCALTDLVLTPDEISIHR